VHMFVSLVGRPFLLVLIAGINFKYLIIILNTRFKHLSINYSYLIPALSI
jgi:hypothetical protein